MMSKDLELPEFAAEKPEREFWMPYLLEYMQSKGFRFVKPSNPWVGYFVPTR